MHAAMLGPGCLRSNRSRETCRYRGWANEQVVRRSCLPDRIPGKQERKREEGSTFGWTACLYRHLGQQSWHTRESRICVPSCAPTCYGPESRSASRDFSVNALTCFEQSANSSDCATLALAVLATKGRITAGTRRRRKCRKASHGSAIGYRR